MNSGFVNFAALIVVICGLLWLLARIIDLLTALGFYEWLERRRDIDEQYRKKGELSPWELFMMFSPLVFGLLYTLWSVLEKMGQK